MLLLLFFYVLSFVQFVPNLRDKRLKVNRIGWPALGRLSSGRGGGYSTNGYTGRLRPWVQPLTQFIYHFFHEKGTPFVYLLMTNGTHFTYLV